MFDLNGGFLMNLGNFEVKLMEISKRDMNRHFEIKANLLFEMYIISIRMP